MEPVSRDVTLHFANCIQSREIERSEGLVHTVSDICEQFMKWKRAGNLKPSTLTKYAVPLRLLDEFFGPTTNLKSLTFEDDEKLGSVPSSNPDQRH